MKRKQIINIMYIIGIIFVIAIPTYLYFNGTIRWSNEQPGKYYCEKHLDNCVCEEWNFNETQYYENDGCVDNPDGSMNCTFKWYKSHICTKYKYKTEEEKHEEKIVINGDPEYWDMINASYTIVETPGNLRNIFVEFNSVKICSYPNGTFPLRPSMCPYESECSYQEICTKTYIDKKLKDTTCNDDFKCVQIVPKELK